MTGNLRGMSIDATTRTILLALESAEDVMALEAATELAALLRGTLHGVFVENQELLRLAQLPFAREISLASATARRPVTSPSIRISRQTSNSRRGLSSKTPGGFSNPASPAPRSAGAAAPPDRAPPHAALGLTAAEYADIRALLGRRLELISRRAKGLTDLMAERQDLTGVYAMADFVAESVRWSA